MRIILIFLMALLMIPSVAIAQDDTAISLNEFVTGEITDREFEVAYTFEGLADEIVIIEMAAVDVFGDFNRPSIILLDPDFGIVSTTDGFNDVTYAEQLPVSGEYTILATRSDGRAGDSIGEYTLRLMKPTILTAGENVNDSATSDLSSYYVVESAEDFTITYRKLDGEFQPTVAIGVLDDGEIDSVASLNGDVSKGSMTLDVTNYVSGVFVIEVREGDFDFNFDTLAADYSLLLEE